MAAAAIDAIDSLAARNLHGIAWRPLLARDKSAHAMRRFLGEDASCRSHRHSHPNHR
jgi:hypothetical protein